MPVHGDDNELNSTGINNSVFHVIISCYGSDRAKDLPNQLLQEDKHFSEKKTNLDSILITIFASCTLPLTHSCLRAKSSWVLIHPYHRCLDRTHSVQPDEIKSHTAHSKQKCCQGDLHGRYPRNQNYLSVPANTKRLESAEAKSILIWSAGLTFGSLNQHLQSAVFKNNTLSVFMSMPKRNPHVIIKGHDSESCAGLLNHLHTFTVLCDGNSEQRQDATFNKILPVLFVL